MYPILFRDFDPVTVMLERHLSQDRDGRGGLSEFSPHVELDETEEHYVMSFDVPGVHRDDISVEMTGSSLVVSGERKRENHGGSRRYGKFQKSFNLPEGVTAEGIVAEHKDGVLRLAIQKPAAARPTKIKVMDGSTISRTGGFFKNLISEKKSKDAVEIRGATAKSEAATAMAN